MDHYIYSIGIIPKYVGLIYKSIWYNKCSSWDSSRGKKGNHIPYYNTLRTILIVFRVQCRERGFESPTSQLFYKNKAKHRLSLFVL